jgi:hypothetical protein
LKSSIKQIVSYTVIEGSSSESGEDCDNLRIASENLESTLDRMRGLNLLSQKKIIVGMVGNSNGPRGPTIPPMHEVIQNHL